MKEFTVQKHNALWENKTEMGDWATIQQILPSDLPTLANDNQIWNINQHKSSPNFCRCCKITYSWRTIVRTFYKVSQNMLYRCFRTWWQMGSLQGVPVWVLPSWLFKPQKTCLADILKREETPWEERVAAGRWHILILSRLTSGTFVRKSWLGFYQHIFFKMHCRKQLK